MAEIAHQISEKNNQAHFGENTDRYISWTTLELVDLSNIPDFKKLCTEPGRQWLITQLDNGIKKEMPTPECDIALDALGIMSEKLALNSPVTVLKVLHDLGSRGDNGIQQGLDRLDTIVAKYSSEEDKKPHLSSVKRIKHNYSTHLCEKYQAYINYLQQGAPAPLLQMMTTVGISIEELRHAVTKTTQRYLRESNSDGNTPLHLAIGIGDHELISNLLQQQEVNFNVVTSKGYSALYTAVTNSNVNVVRALASDARVDVNKADQTGRVALHEAVEAVNLQILTTLVKHPSIDINKADNMNITALWEAANEGDLDCIKLLLQFGADKTIKNHGEYPRSPEEIARENGFEEIANFIANYQPTVAGQKRLRSDNDLDPNSHTSDGSDGPDTKTGRFH